MMVLQFVSDIHKERLAAVCFFISNFFCCFLYIYIYILFLNKKRTWRHGMNLVLSLHDNLSNRRFWYFNLSMVLFCICYLYIYF